MQEQIPSQHLYAKFRLDRFILLSLGAKIMPKYLNFENKIWNLGDGYPPSPIGVKWGSMPLSTMPNFTVIGTYY